MIALILRAIEKYLPKPEQLGTSGTSCLVASFGRILVEARPYPMWSGLDFGRLSAATAPSTSDNQEHEPRISRLARLTLSHPIGILSLGKP